MFKAFDVHYCEYVINRRCVAVSSFLHAGTARSQDLSSDQKYLTGVVVGYAKEGSIKRSLVSICC